MKKKNLFLKLLTLNLLLTLPLLAVEVGTTPPTLTLERERWSCKRWLFVEF